MTINLDDRVFIRRAQSFVPADVHAEEMLNSVKLNAECILSRRTARNVAHHRRLFALLKVACDHSTRYSDPVVFLSDLKVLTGLATMRFNYLTGEVYPVEQSISFSAMSQSRFDEWYKLATEKISEHLGIDIETLAAEVWAQSERKAF
jgi:hypothetical protein